MLNSEAVGPLLLAFFFILGLGYLLRITGRLQPSQSDTLNLVVTDLTLPAMLISALSGQTLRLSMLGAVFSACAACFGTLLLGLFIARLLKLSPQMQGTMSLCSGFSNTGFIGIPLIIALYGSTPGAAATAALIDTFVTTLFLYTFGVAWAIYFGQQGKFDKRSLIKLLTAPTLPAVLISLALNAAGIKLPGWFLNAAHLLGNATVPLVLLSLGLRFDFNVLKGRSMLLLIVTTLKMGISPLIALLMVKSLHLHGVIGQATTLECAMPTAMTSALISASYGGDGPLGTGAVVLTTALTALLLPLTISMMMHWRI